MSEITIGTIIKIILGLLVVVAVAYAVYRIFGDYVFGSFKNIGLNSTIKLILTFL